MQIVTETITVIADRAHDEVGVVMDGHCIMLSHDEARLLAAKLAAALGEPVARSVAAQVADQIVSWAEISETVTPRPR